MCSINIKDPQTLSYLLQTNPHITNQHKTTKLQRPGKCHQNWQRINVWGWPFKWLYLHRFFVWKKYLLGEKWEKAEGLKHHYIWADHSNLTLFVKVSVFLIDLILNEIVKCTVMKPMWKLQQLSYRKTYNACIMSINFNS